jgi:Tfp pilus assembly major pilin PilA
MKSQKGFTFWSLTFTVGTIAIIALLTMKLLPAYSEFFAIKKAISRLETEGSLPAMSEAEIRRAFDRSSGIDDIHSIQPKDLKIRRTNDGETVVSAEYEVIIPLVANVSALLKFNASTSNTKRID